MSKYIYIISGGAVGSVLRYLLGEYLSSKFIVDFPLGTLAINLSGSFMIGLLYGFLSVNGVVDEKLRLFLFVGFLGGFTTFSAFALENVKLLNSGDISVSLIYILASNIFGLALAFLGYFLGSFIK